MMLHSVGLALVAAMMMPPAVQSQRSRCADCHFANLVAAGHLDEWDRSPHGRHDIGCDRCHGGDSSTFEPVVAHRGILPPTNAASPVNRDNLPRTCGVCHVGPYIAFQKSRHYAMLQNENADAPTCSTCHGEVAAHLLSPRALEAQCNKCHGAGKPAARPDRAAQARRLLESVEQVRVTLDTARAQIDRIKDKARRRAFEDQWTQAHTPLVQARDAAHAFVFDGSEARLSVARERADRLAETLANAGQH